MQRQPERNELRCAWCSRRPKLAYYGIDKDGNPYVHQKVYKQGRIYGESIARGGTLEIKCRECNRWNKIRITKSGEVIRPPSTESEPDAAASVSLFTDSPGK